MSASPYLKLPEAATYARVSIRTLQRYLKSGTLRRHGLGHRVLIDRAELETLLAAGKTSQERDSE